MQENALLTKVRQAFKTDLHKQLVCLLVVLSRSLACQEHEGQAILRVGVGLLRCRCEVLIGCQEVNMPSLRTEESDAFF